MDLRKMIVAVFAVCFASLHGLPPTAGQAAAALPQQNVKAPLLNKIRYSQSAEKTRIVLDVSAIPEYTVVLDEEAKRLVITLQNTNNKNVLPVIDVKDNLVQQIITVPGNDSVTITVDLAFLPRYESFILRSPQRIVIDLLKTFELNANSNLAPGITYTAINKRTADGPLAIYILDYDLKSSSVKLDHVLAKDGIARTETVKSMADRYNAVAAVNGTYFSTTGELLGLVIQEGQIVQTPIEDRSAFALTYADDVLIDQVGYAGEIMMPAGAKCPISAVNRERGQDDLVVYTPVYGATTRTNNYGTEYTVIDGRVSRINTGNSPIPANGVVISGHGMSEKALAPLKTGDAVTVRHQLNPQWSNVRLAVGAGPQLLRDGAVYLTTKTEGFGSDVAGGRAPRTALGVNAQGHLLLVTVDGRQPGYSIGMTLVELAKLMKELGAVNAMNLDGGGSSEVVVNGNLANRPSDGRERPVGDALLFIRKEKS